MARKMKTLLLGDRGARILELLSQRMYRKQNACVIICMESYCRLHYPDIIEEVGNTCKEVDDEY